MPSAGRALGAFGATVVIVCGVLYLPQHRFYFHAGAYAEFFERLPVTLELITASVTIALVLAAVFMLLSRGPTVWLGAIVAALLFAAACIPVFWIAHIAQPIITVHTGIGHLVLPATLLALLQAGAYVDSLRGGISARRLFATFALLLPAILSADMVVETFFAWPGVARSFYISEPYHTSYMAAFLLLSAAAVIIVRAVGGVVSRSEQAGSAEVFQPL